MKKYCNKHQKTAGSRRKIAVLIPTKVVFADIKLGLFPLNENKSAKSHQKQQNKNTNHLISKRLVF